MASGTDTDSSAADIAGIAHIVAADLAVDADSVIAHTRHIAAAEHMVASEAAALRTDYPSSTPSNIRIHNRFAIIID